MTLIKEYKTKFSRQIFIQYFISAVLPVLVLSYFSYTSVTELLDKNANRQIYAEGRAIGLTLFDRFLNLESNLLFASKYIERKEELKQYLWLNKMFHSIYILNEGVVDDVIFGSEGVAYNLSAKETSHVNKKGLLVFINDGEKIYPLVIQKLDGNKYLVGKVNLDYLWNMSITGNDIFCVLIKHKDLVFCSSARGQIQNYLFEADQGINIKALSKVEPRSVSIEESEYITNAWDLFLEPQFGVESFLVLYFIEKHEAFLDYNYYKSVFPQTILLTLVFVFFLSSVQMRRSLTPLLKLTQGVKNISEGDFTKKVDINSKNEFEYLGHAFNDMSDKINDQFNKIKTLSEIDRLILLTSEQDKIIEILIRFVPTFIDCEYVAILTFDKELTYYGTVFYCDKSVSDELNQHEVTLSQDEYAELINAEAVLKKYNIEDASYLKVTQKKELELFKVCAIKSKDKLLGAFIVGFKKEQKDDSACIQSLIELADRAAVGISNAQWEKKLYRLAHYDALTELPNRYLFRDRLEQAIERAKRNDLNIAVFFIDLDRFKSVNDSLGHAVGDKLLIEVSNVLSKCVRTYDSVARFGGDEYIIVLSDIEPKLIEKKTEQLAKRILNLMSKAILIDEREFYITPSIGISIYPRDADNFDDLLKNADIAMYKAKNITVGSFQYYQPVEISESLDKIELENDLRHAFEKQQFKLYFQPKINLADNKIYDVEALIRWEHPEKGTLLPEVFIPIAEEIGLIDDLGFWVMWEACSINKKWEEAGYPLNTAINISADQFRYTGLYDKILNIIFETEVSAEKIEFEITESIMIESFDKTIKLFNKLQELGISICLDDFGTGYSSLTYLKRIPINKLKIDKSFIDNIHTDKGVSSIARSIISLSHNLDLKVVAEGVELEEQFKFLSENECDEIQGYYISVPLEESRIIDFIKKYNRED